MKQIAILNTQNASDPGSPYLVSASAHSIPAAEPLLEAPAGLPSRAHASADRCLPLSHPRRRRALTAASRRSIPSFRKIPNARSGAVLSAMLSLRSDESGLSSGASSGLSSLLSVLVFAGILLLASPSAHAQDPGFSQFFASPLTLNPALTGKFNGVLRVAGNYRNQWPAINNAFITSTISVDAPILTNKLPVNDTWGIGVIGMTDKTASGILNDNYFGISTAYHLALDEDGYHSIGVGFQGVYANQSLDGTRLTFEDGLQLDGTFLRSPSEAINSEFVQVHYFDANMGVLYNASTNGNNNFYLGASGYHLNHPKASFLGEDTINVPIRLTFHGGGYFPITGTASTIYVSGLVSNQAGARQYVLGGAWESTNNNDESNPVNFYAGIWARFTNNTTDAIIPYLGLDYSDFSLGVTYDVNVSALSTASQSRGGIEISLIYIKKAASGKHGVPCPKF
jgi:type IX secretion system PorP/SprF family membrane protein